FGDLDPARAKDAVEPEFVADGQGAERGLALLGQPGLRDLAALGELGTRTGAAEAGRSVHLAIGIVARAAAAGAGDVLEKKLFHAAYPFIIWRERQCQRAIRIARVSKPKSFRNQVILGAPPDRGVTLFKGRSFQGPLGRRPKGPLSYSANIGQVAL